MSCILYLHEETMLPPKIAEIIDEQQGIDALSLLFIVDSESSRNKTIGCLRAHRAPVV